MRTNEELSKLCYGDLLRLVREQEQQIATLADEVRRLNLAARPALSAFVRNKEPFAGVLVACNGEPIE
jgi:hypothetical protein